MNVGHKTNLFCKTVELISPATLLFSCLAQLKAELPLIYQHRIRNGG